MLIKNHLSLESDCNITLDRLLFGRHTLHGAFPDESELTLRMRAPRIMGVSGVVLRLTRDGEGSIDIPFDFVTVEGGSDVYETRFVGSLGLYFSEILLIRGADTLFVTSVNNLDFELSHESGEPFHLLFYKRDFETPDWVKGGTMYHIFVDRFKRGDGEVGLHGVINGDWDNGIPQYAERPGDPLSNDVFFGGNLWGVIEKLDYLEELGVNIIYLSPVFESVSNHRYDTSDYENIDSLLGGRPAFDALIREAHERGMRVILDGVFNHTGDDSRYFNRRHRYDVLGAYESPDSLYADWFNFTEFPDKYEAWWGIEIMPRLMHANESCRRYFTGEGGIIEHWLKAGADGWRLDVADELSDDFLDELNATAKRTKDAFVVGEVWENAAVKTAYGYRRRYFRGGQLDSVMNYPFRNAVLALLCYGDTRAFYNTLTELYASYPPPVLHSLMNIISTHDTERIITLLGDMSGGDGLSNAELSVKRLSPEARARAKELLKIASSIQYTVFGFPSLYYGDETGLEGYHDPFCRMPYPWGREDAELIEHYKMLGALRREHECLREGSFEFLHCREGELAYRRTKGKDSLSVLVNLKETDCMICGQRVSPRSCKII